MLAPLASRFLVVLAFLFTPQDATATGDAQTHRDDGFQPKVKPSLQIRRAPGDITIDGELGDPGWQKAAHATGFTEVQPREEVEPLVKTDAYVTYDEGHLYLAFRAHDDPEKVRASLQNRDAIFQDDWVGIILDPYGDATRAYELFANPLGIQGDLLMTDQGEDAGFDVLYASEGQVTEDGYQVEMAIPFSSLRFPEQQHRWRITFLRNHPRADRHVYSWATVKRDDPCLLCQLGSITGLRDVQASKALDVLPAFVGSQSGSRADTDDPASRFDNDPVRVEPSLNLRYDLTSSLAAEATLNPDFSQVASDAAQIDVNTTFALSFPERRPFFQEGSELLDTAIDMVYTRSINDPIAAAKTTRRGATSLVYLSAVDGSTPLLLPFEEESSVVQAGRSASNILRVRRSVGESSYVGGMVSDRRLFEGGAGTEAGVDLGYQFWKHYRVEGQLVLSRTAEPDSSALSATVEGGTFDRGAHTAALDGERFWGHGAYLNLERETRRWDTELSYRGYSPTFRTANGFVRRNDFHAFSAEQNVNFYPDWEVMNFFNPSIGLEHEINFAGTQKKTILQPELEARFTGQTYLYSRYRFQRERFRGVAFTGLQDWLLNVSSRFSEVVNGAFYISGGEAIRRTEDPELGRKLEAGMILTFKPLQRLVIEPEVSYARLRDSETGEYFYSGYIARMRTSLQLTRALSLRLITQYDDFSDRLDVEPLLSYELNPYSVFYLGSKVDYGAYDAPHGLTTAERQFFFKFQYLFRI